MIDLDMTLKGLEPNKPPTLKDCIRAHMPAIEEARANGVPWKVILHTLEAVGIVIDPQLLASYVCQIRKTMRPPATAQADDLPMTPTPSRQTKPPHEQVAGGIDKPLRQVAGGLLAPHPLQ
ncbi:MAG: hypothetical protein K2Z25_13910 [Beijerinckiaceae bacterium]|nr:hypothetical protein [Beijerinckiaceae bacterium]